MSAEAIRKPNVALLSTLGPPFCSALGAPEWPWQALKELQAEASRPTPTMPPTVTPQPTATPQPTPTLQATPKSVPKTPPAQPTNTPTEEDRLRALIRPEWPRVVLLVEDAPRLLDVAQAARLRDVTTMGQEWTEKAEKAFQTYLSDGLIWIETWEALPRLKYLRDLIDKAGAFKTELFPIAWGLPPLEPCTRDRCLRRSPFPAYEALRELQEAFQDLRVFMGEG